MALQSDTTEALPDSDPQQARAAAHLARVYQIQYTNRTDRYDAHERIQSVGGLGNQGSLWVLSQAEAVTAIESGQLEFFIDVAGQRERVIVAVAEGGQRYLKTETDGAQPNNLLDLPESRWVVDLSRGGDVPLRP